MATKKNHPSTILFHLQIRIKTLEFASKVGQTQKPDPKLEQANFDEQIS
jgi:hypothetical protein